MPQILHLTLAPEVAADLKAVRKIVTNVTKKPASAIEQIRILKKSVDARQKNIKVNLIVEVFSDGEVLPVLYSPLRVRDVSRSREVIVVGAGPAGLFAALRLIELGIRPVILERGRDVSSRKRDIAMISREHIVDPDSNYCFGEGGAGTYSDGKLYTRSRKRGDNARVLELFCYHGADENILYESHPHLGSDRLPGIVSSIRHSIEQAGGLLLFEKKVTGFITGTGGIEGVTTHDQEKYMTPEIILATGHSARDIYRLLYSSNITMEAKSFALGVRVEHPQDHIDRIRYHGNPRGSYLPAASYNIARQVENRGVYSFCMCPGGFIVPSATSQEEVVVNGMSPSGRNSPYANSGIVVEIHPEDLAEYRQYETLAGMMFQVDYEHEAWLRGGKTQAAPAQRLADFVAGLPSASLPKVSYFPGVTGSSLHEWLPRPVAKRLQEGFRQFGNAMKGYVTNDAVILGVESRTSSPVRIPRDPVTLEHKGVEGLFPCGEGSGYAGGIVSSAVDGFNTAEAVARKINK